MTSLTLCVIALDEQDMLPGLLDSVDRIVDEVILGIDTRTTDHTERVACKYGARIKDIDWCDDFSYARNLTIDAATGAWILVLDPDERLLPAGAQAIRDILDCAPDEPAANAVTGISFINTQRWLDGTTVSTQRSSIRLFRRRPEIRYRGIVHEEPVWLPDPKRTTAAQIEGGPHFEHYGYDPMLWQGRGKHQRNVRLLEQRIQADPDDQYAREKLDALLRATFVSKT